MSFAEFFNSLLGVSSSAMLRCLDIRDGWWLAQRRAPGVVAVNPSRIGVGPHPGVGAGFGLDRGGARLARPFVEPECLFQIVPARLLEAAREHGRVLQRG